MKVRPASTRGRTKLGWLDSFHSFSFGGWHDPRYMGIPPLRVLNDDLVQPGKGFGEHPHRDMEIVSYVVSGALAHRDSHGNAGVVSAGEAQFMRAGTGVVHSEMNASEDAPAHFLQVWFQPRKNGLAPKYDQRRLKFPMHGGFAEIAGPTSFELEADVRMLALRIPAAGRASYDVDAARQAYLYLIDGDLSEGRDHLRPGDAGVQQGGALDLRSNGGAHAVVFDLPM